MQSSLRNILSLNIQCTTERRFWWCTLIAFSILVYNDIFRIFISFAILLWLEELYSWFRFHIYHLNRFQMKLSARMNWAFLNTVTEIAGKFICAQIQSVKTSTNNKCVSKGKLIFLMTSLLLLKWENCDHSFLIHVLVHCTMLSECPEDFSVGFN